MVGQIPLVAPQVGAELRGHCRPAPQERWEAKARIGVLPLGNGHLWRGPLLSLVFQNLCVSGVWPLAVLLRNFQVAFISQQKMNNEYVL